MTGSRQFKSAKLGPRGATWVFRRASEKAVHAVAPHVSSTPALEVLKIPKEGVILLPIMAMFHVAGAEEVMMNPILDAAEAGTDTPSVETPSDDVTTVLPRSVEKVPVETESSVARTVLP